MNATVRKIDTAERAKKEGMYLRRIIRRNKGGILTNSEVKVLVLLVNLWLYHRNGPKGYIHPGCSLIAKKVKVHRNTVSTSLDLFRTLGIAKAIKHIKGGNGRATQYTIDTVAIQDLFDPSNVTTLSGVLVPFSAQERAENCALQPHKNCALSIGIVSHCPIQESASFEGGDNE